MKLSWRQIGSLLLLMAFIWPSVVKHEHHHHHEDLFVEMQGRVFLQHDHENCAVCNFEFSVFDDLQSFIRETGTKPENHSPVYRTSVKYSTFPDFSFLLRGPPLASI